jgi:hypothetical protein
VKILKSVSLLLLTATLMGTASAQIAVSISGVNFKPQPAKDMVSWGLIATNVGFVPGGGSGSNSGGEAVSIAPASTLPPINNKTIGALSISNAQLSLLTLGAYSDNRWQLHLYVDNNSVRSLYDCATPIFTTKDKSTLPDGTFEITGPNSCQYVPAS